MPVTSNLLRPIRCVARHVRRLASDVRGFAAVEFAMVVPLMVIMLLGSVEISEALTVDSRLNIIGDSVGDLVARSTSVSSADLKDIMKIGKTLLGKYQVSNLRMEVVSLVVDPATSTMKVDWSYNSRFTQPYAHNANPPYAGNWEGMISSGNSLIVSTATYDFTSPIGKYIHGTIKLKHQSSHTSRVSQVTFVP